MFTRSRRGEMSEQRGVQCLPGAGGVRLVNREVCSVYQEQEG